MAVVGRAAVLVAASAAALACAGCGGSHRDARVTLSAHAASRLADSPVRLDVHGLQAHERATLRARWTAFGGAVWSSAVPERADAHGSIDLRGVDGMRWLWAMRPADARRRHALAFLPPAAGATAVTLSVTAGGRPVARARLQRRVTPASVRVRALTRRGDGLVGFLFSPPVRGRRPAALVFGGSEGGDSMIDAAGLLAAHGYPALALAYFGDPGLPRRLERIALEYFARAARLLRRQAGVDPVRVLPVGVSRGGEAALLLAATFPSLLHGAIGLVPSAFVNPSPDGGDIPAWTLHGRPVPQAQIAVERIRGPVLTVAAGEDAVWDSTTSAGEVEQRLRTARFRFPHRALTYDEAGHDVGAAVPYLPQPVNQAHFGGTARGSAIAKADLWPRILRFFGDL